MTQVGNGEFWMGDCLDLMRDIPYGSVDMILCDLPYGTTRNKWDSVIPFEPLWEQYNRICNGAIVLTSCQPFTSKIVMSNMNGFKHDWVWEKNKASGHLNAKRRPMRSHEEILVFGKPTYCPQMTRGHKPGNYAKRAAQSSNYGVAKSTKYGGQTVRYPRTVQQFPVVNNDDPDKWHPTQKPVALFEYLIRTYTNPGDLVLDNCAGSGTTAIAAERSGRRWLCIEREPEYYFKAYQRVWQEVNTA